jgi:hypothetical protein
MLRLPPRLTSVLVPLGLLAAGLAVAFWPMWSSGFGLMQVDPADSRHLNFVLEWGHRWLTTKGLSLWAPPFFYPEPNVSAFTEVLLGLVPFYSAWRLLGLAPDSAFQAWMVTMGALNFIVGWLLCRKALAMDAGAAAVGAFLLSFGGVRLNQLNHQHLLPHFFTFIALHALVRLFTGAPRPRGWLAIFTSSVVLQLYAGVQLGWFLVFTLGLAALWAFALRSTRGPFLALLRAQWLPLLGCLVLGGLALLPLAQPYLQAMHTVGARSFAEASPMLPRAQSWLNQGPHNWVSGALANLHLFRQLPMEGEHRLGLGPVTTAVVLVVFWRSRRKPLFALVGLCAASLMVLTTTHGPYSPWQVVMAVVPGAAGIRAVARVGLLLLVPAALGVASLVQTRARWWALPLAAWCLLEQGQRVPDCYDKDNQRSESARVVQAVPRSCQAFFWAPRESPPYEEKTQLNAMWAALELGVPTVNGYSSNFPRGWGLMQHTVVTGDDEARLRTALRAWTDSRGLDPGVVCFVVQQPATP